MTWTCRQLMYEAPFAIALGLALFLSIRHRAQAPKAANLAIIAWFSLAGWKSYDILMISAGYDAVEASAPQKWWPIIFAISVVKSAWNGASIVLLCIAIGSCRSGNNSRRVLTANVEREVCVDHEALYQSEGVTAIRALIAITIILTLVSGCIMAFP